MDQLFTPERIAETFDRLVETMLIHGPRLLIALLVFIFASRALQWGLGRLEKDIIARNNRRSDMPRETEKRIQTLFSVFRKGLVVLIWAVAAMVGLSIIGVNIGPIVATLGVFGLAVSFGAQALVRDVISGMFLLFENQIRVGDVANINGTPGLVEQINLRTTVLRDNTGTVHVFPNGKIDRLSNLTKDWSAVVLEIGVAYKEDIDNVMAVIAATCAEMRTDDTFGPMITADAEIQGVDSFGDSAVVIRMRMKTLPNQQWNVARQLRRRIKYAFDKHGIEIPFPHRTVYFGEASSPFQISSVAPPEKPAA